MTDETDIYDYFDENLPHLFISYSHTEREKVINIIRLMRRNGINLWYDININAGDNWNDVIKQKLIDSKMFVCFLANGIEQRSVVLEEIRMAIDKNKKDSGYKIIFIFLEKMPFSAFDEDISEVIKSQQHIIYDGITDEFIKKLINRKVISSDFIDNDFRIKRGLSDWNEAANYYDFVYNLPDILLNNSYVYPQEFPEFTENENFYRVRPKQMHPDAVFPLCLDDQWCPTEFYSYGNFSENGFNDPTINELRQNYQKTEIFRALLHNRQMILNRAAILNTHIFNTWYNKEKEEYKAFTHLLYDGSILIYLMTEERPLQFPKNIYVTNKERWTELCKNNITYCLRLDWDNNENNNRLAENHLSGEFQQFCLSLPQREILLRELEELFDFSPDEATLFRQTCIDIQMQLACRDRKSTGNTFARTNIYKEFFIKENSNTSQCLLDNKTPFTVEIKQIIDFKYSTNLPKALGARIIYPEKGNFKRLSQIFFAGNEGRSIRWDELICAIGQFEPYFITDTVYTTPGKMNLNTVCELRDLTYWKAYMNTISAGRKRASLNEVDFYDIQYVWKAYYNWINQAKNETDLEWIEKKGCISVIYQLGGIKIIAVYYKNKEACRYTVIRKSTNAENRIVPIYIEYIFSDILEDDYTQSSIVAPLPLFEGVSADTAEELTEKIVGRYKDMGFVENITSEQKQTDTEHCDTKSVQLQHIIHKKKKSKEWTEYSKLMQDRPEEFYNSDGLEIITDINAICEFEIKTNKTIGVRYSSPYSILVVDMVKDNNGNVFSYERIMPAVPHGAVVSIPMYEGKFILLKQFRHAMRTFQLGFPRGFAEEGLSAEDNVKKELAEELGCKVKSVVALGQVIADSGANGNKVNVFACEITEPELKKNYEGIKEYISVTGDELRQMISDGSISDGYTLSAYSLLSAKENNNLIT